MNVSLGEVESMARKAARGAGYSWGIADEAGFAVRWLEAREKGGIAAFAKLLKQSAAGDVANRAPLKTTDWKADTDWTSHSGTLCPILTGATLADAAALIEGGTLTLSNVAEPRLLLPFIAHVATVRDHPLRVETNGCIADTWANALALTGDWADIGAVRITIGTVRPTPNALQTRAAPDVGDWNVLNDYAAKTYAPATEASRLKGAGAGLNDND